MRKIRDFFTQNILWKLLSFALAIILWFMAINIQNPIFTWTYHPSLQLRNMDILDEHNIVLLNEGQVRNMIVDTNVTARWSELSTISVNNINAYIDMANINFHNENITASPVQTIVSVQVDTNHEHQASVIRPTIVFLSLDRVITEEIPVVVEKVSDVDSGFVSLAPRAHPETLMVTGAESHIRNIETIVAQVDIQGETDNFTDFVTPIIYNHEGRDITYQFETNVPEVQVSVPVNRHASIAISSPNISGNVASGYAVTGISFEPQRVEVIGSLSDINAIQSIPLGSVNVSGATSSQRFIIDIRPELLGTNVNVRQGTPHQVAVTVHINNDPIINIPVPISQFYILGDTDNMHFESIVNVNLKGKREVIENIDYSYITGVIHVEGLEAGQHSVEIDVILPPGITLIGNALVTVIVEEEEVQLPPEEPSETIEYQEVALHDESVDNTEYDNEQETVSDTEPEEETDVISTTDIEDIEDIIEEE